MGGGFIFGLIGAVLIWAGVQLTLNPALKADIQTVEKVILAAMSDREYDQNRGIGPVNVSSDVCTMLTAGEGVKRSFARFAFLTASRSADALRERFRFVPVTPCHRGAGNQVLAYPLGK